MSMSHRHVTVKTDDIDFDTFLTARKSILDEENQRLNNQNTKNTTFINKQSADPSVQNDCKSVHTNDDDDNEPIHTSESEEKENRENHSLPSDQIESNVLTSPAAQPNPSPSTTTTTTTTHRQNVPLLTKQHLSYVDISKEPPINHLFRSDASNRPAMLRYGDYSPNNLHLKVPSQPHLGLGEYDQQKRRQFLRHQRFNDHKHHLNKTNQLIKSTSIKLKKSSSYHKAVQTDIQNINKKLIQYSRATNLETHTAEGDLIGLPPTNLSTIESCVMHNNRSPVLHRLDQRITAAHSNLLKSEMDKQPRGILTNRNQTPRERLLSDLKHSYLPPGNLYNGYSYPDRNDQMERERIKRELYQNELRLQIEEKRRLATMREEQERREQELENKRLEQQLLRMQEEQLRDEQRRNRREMIRRNSDDFATRKQEMQSRFRKHAESESGMGNIRSTTVASKMSSHYSPPVSRRNHVAGLSSVSASALPYNSYNVAAGGSHSGSTQYTDPSSSRYDSLSRIDSLKQQDALNSRLESLSLNESLSRVQRRHSATQQDLSMSSSRRSPKLQRRSSSSRFEDSLPIPLLKAHSPVARELKYSQAVTSTSRYSSSEALRKLEDKWQIPAVQKNYVNRINAVDANRKIGVGGGTSSCRSILTQLGAIRMQLQREQMRMDDTLKERERASMSHTDNTS